MTKASDRLRSHEAHMDRVRAVHRRSAYARVLDKIAILQTWLREVDKDGFDTANEREQLKYLIELRDMIRKELVEHGQIEA